MRERERDERSLIEKVVKINSIFLCSLFNETDEGSRRRKGRVVWSIKK